MSNQISELLPQLMVAVGAIGKDRRNQHQNYQFRGIDDVLNHVGPPCAELGIRVSPTIHDYQSNVVEWEDGGKHKFQVRVTLRMRLEFTAPDGSVHVAEAVGEAIDTNGDKASNKAMSAAFKYACFMGIVIPVSGALDDSDTDDKQPTRPAAKPPAQRPASRTVPPEPEESPEQRRERFISKLGPVKESALELFREWGWIAADDGLSSFPLDKVPKTKREFDGIMTKIQSYMDGETGPVEDRESFWDVVIPVPRKGQKRPDYMKDPDTIRSLYEAGKGGDDDARKRLFGFANNWQPTGWKKRDGTEMPPSEADNAARAALDQFLQWEKEKEQ